MFVLVFNIKPKASIQSYTRRQMSPSKTCPASPLYGRRRNIDSDLDTSMARTRGLEMSSNYSERRLGITLDPPPSYDQGLTVAMTDQLELNNLNQSNDQNINDQNANNAQQHTALFNYDCDGTNCCSCGGWGGCGGCGRLHLSIPSPPMLLVYMVVMILLGWTIFQLWYLFKGILW